MSDDPRARAERAVTEGYAMARCHPLIAPLPQLLLRPVASDVPADAFVRVTAQTPTVAHQVVEVVPSPRREPREVWAYVFARLAIHVALCHLTARTDLAFHAAAWVQAEELVAIAGIGRRPGALDRAPQGFARGDVEALAARFGEEGVPAEVMGLSLGRRGEPFWRYAGDPAAAHLARETFASWLAQGVRAAARAAIDVAGGELAHIAGPPGRRSVWGAARSELIASHPLLAATASAFALIEDAGVCRNLRVSVAAVSDEACEVYLNPDVTVARDEALFILAHEFLHAGLRHTARRQGRDSWLWNVACDYVINGWLIEMALGTPPEAIGYLHDGDLKGLSAEAIYDRIVSDLRLMRRLRKARGMNGGEPDMLDGPGGPRWWQGGGADLDAFYRRALAEGLDLHRASGRGRLPAGLVEEIRALSQPPISWDVALAEWLDRFVPPLERRRTYARAHRRQSATPDVPRPAWVVPQDTARTRTFAALIDTSGSMDRMDLGRAVGAVAAYAMSRDVSAVRLVYCDAAPHDAGYVDPAALLERVAVRGRGGTELQPAVSLLERAADYPPDGPILVITDGACDRLTVRREHAYLMAGKGRLPFNTRAPVFRLA